MTNSRLLPMIGAAACAAISSLQASAGPVEVDTLAWAVARNGNDLGPTYGGVSALPTLSIPWGRTIAILPHEIAVSGETTAADDPRFGESAFGVWIFETPAADDPIVRYGPSHTQTLVPIPAAPGVGAPYGFGASVVGDDRWLFVGAAKTSIGSVTGAGAVHVYRRVAPRGAWQPFAVLSSPTPELDIGYGTSLAFDGTTLVIGVPGRKADAGTPTTGGADLHTIGADAIGPGAAFTAPLVGSPTSALGTRVAVSGERFALSDPAAKAAPGSGTGVVLTASVADLSLESTLVSPTGQLSTKFGTTIELDGDRLVVAAPLEDFGGVTDRGAARVYTRSRDAWLATHVVYGASSNAELTAISLDGDLLAVGSSKTKNFPGGGVVEYGRATLYLLGDASPVLLASAAPAPVGPSEFRSLMGSQVAVRHGRWCFTETIETSSFGSKSVRCYPTAAALSDCDGDGQGDTAEVLSGAPDIDGNGAPDDCPSALQPDCDADGVADSSQTMLVWPTAPYVGTEATWFYVLAGNYAVAAMWLAPRTVPEGSDGVLRGVEADWVSTPGHVPQPVFVAIYDDPNQDGDPSDASFRAAWRARVAASPGRDRVFVDPIAIGPGGTRYFVGAGVLALPPSGASLALRDDTSDAASIAPVWIVRGAGSSAADLDLEHPSKNAVYEPFDGASAMAVEGLFRPAIDRDGNATPDGCECAADLDASGDVGAADLGALLGAWGSAGADLDGSGTTDAGDLAALVASWGPC